ncbi:hypothetical protein [Methanosalsum natronophilum]|uniref:hypothetical protein n=1 Tax=Methanosalsum natronophilum TaxID=768733 RepID=UPI002167281C|nr:hypothetical protein [Methanosalsum natronophilum]MCS3924113.1 hypothetical protein [Methanosalsum natronophilum]
MKSKIVLLILVLSTVLLLSGCVDMTIDSKIDRDGNINHYDIKLEMDSITYDLINEEEPLEQEVERMGGTYSETWEEGTVTVIMEFDNADPEIIEVTSRVENGYLVFEDKLASDRLQMYSGFTLTYNLEMPGPIVETNADVVSENTAQWNISGPGELETIYAKSEIPTIPMPGAYVLILILAVFGLALIKYRH